MKSLLDLFLRSVGLGRRKPTTLFSKVVRHTDQVTSLIAFAWFALQLFPQIIFPYKASAEGITIYARTTLPPEALVRIAETNKLLPRSELAVPGRSHRIFLCNNPVLFGFLVPSSRARLRSRCR